MKNEPTLLEFDSARLFDLTDRVAIITGGAGALGESFAHGLLSNGARVVIADIDVARGQELVAALELRCKGHAVFQYADVAVEEDVRAVLGKAISQFGKVDILVNNAAAPVCDPAEFFAPFETFSLEEWRRQMSVSLDGMFLMARETVRQMIAQGGGGAIVQISSIYGLLSSDERIYDGAMYRGNNINNPVSYSAAKAGVIGMTRWMAANLSKHNIRVNSIAPGGVFTGENDTFTQRYGDRVPMGRMAHRHEIVGGVLYLVSDAASYVTGQCLAIDGGLSAW
ncbi:SDR family oxidoreductase [Alphaproteobacteria bacterium]|nr:SDR family oxidoreductase [Alphaproteobacteria bacterium]